MSGNCVGGRVQILHARAAGRWHIQRRRRAVEEAEEDGELRVCLQEPERFQRHCVQGVLPEAVQHTEPSIQGGQSCGHAGESRLLTRQRKFVTMIVDVLTGGLTLCNSGAVHEDDIGLDLQGGFRG
jgi:hypothetical protein